MVPTFARPLLPPPLPRSAAANAARRSPPGLPHAEAIFDLDFFRENPRPFYRLCKELWPGRYRPTPAHAFIRLLADKGKLRRCFTQVAATASVGSLGRDG